MPKMPISYLIFLRDFSAFSSYLVPILNSLPCLVHDGLPEVEIFVCLNIAPIRRRGMDCIKLLVEHTKIHPKDMIFDTSVDFFLQILKDSTNIDEELE